MSGDQVQVVLVQGVVQVPVLLVLVAGLILVAARRDRLSRLARGLAVAGCGVLLIGVLANVAWLASIPTLLRAGQSAAEFGVISAAVALVLNLCQAVGLGLLIGGVLTGGIRPPVAAGQPVAMR
ncbi:hypothetical protein [Plantactinospora sp. KLBMP9567]|uniref:hypothetical protein n=1 Tax=Plantactinospora sp. KLBMP9567 TaxID=3085900 RepID=UPI0029826CD5|nr:hypothetical protein [Plantactinospora sp. KLBMP9567]MDW5322234.1 hypothetical protein [Plantactinospora sp. KLBMP9567]